MKFASAFLLALSSTASYSSARIVGGTEDRKLEAYNPDEDKNYLQILTDRFPECAENKLDAYQCEQFIKTIHETAGVDAPDFSGLKTLVLSKRTVEDETYNAVVIPMYANDIVKGRASDGIIYYDFPWNGSGLQATEEAIKSTFAKIGPSKYTKYVVANSVYGTEADLSCGGDYDPFAVSKPDGKARLDAILSQPITIPPAGPRNIGPFNCSDMSGKDCCKMIKHLVPDMDLKGNTIQGWLTYAKGEDAAVKDFKDELGTITIVDDGSGGVGYTPELKRGFFERKFFE